MTTASGSCKPESKTASLTMRPSLAISKHSSVKGTPEAIREWLMLSVVDSHASPSALPGSVKGQQMTGTCGPQCSVSSAWYDPATHLWKTSLDLFPMDTSIESLGILPKAGMTVGGEFYQQPKWELRIREIGYGLLATPAANEGGGAVNPDTTEHVWEGTYWRRQDGSKVQTRLKDQVRMWPTPEAKNGTSGPDYARRNRKYSGADDLVTAVAMYPTPDVGMAKGRGVKSAEARGRLGGSLNPDWVELLMMWPKLWTSLTPMSHVNMLFWLMGNIGDETRRFSEILRYLQSGLIQKEIQRETGRPFSFSQTSILLAELCEHQGKPEQAREIIEGAEVVEGGVRSLRGEKKNSDSSYRSESGQQRSEEPPDAMQILSRLLAQYGPAAMQNGSWENAVPRVATGIKNRANRLKAIGNGQVPLVAATAWRLLNG